jgi:hypothetical protein
LILKRTDGSTPYGDWYVQHRSISATNYLQLNSTAAQTGSPDAWNSTYATSSVFTVGPDNNQSGFTYVVYLFAHNAGGFGLTETDNVISCGSFTTNGSGAATVSLGYEPQWVMMKRSDGVEGWWMTDNMRGNSLTSYAYLYANASDAEAAGSGTYVMAPTATGFLAQNLNASATYIYIAIRRGPMKVPTTGTSVFAANTRTGTGANTSYSTGLTADLVTSFNRGGGYRFPFVDRLRGFSRQVVSELPNDEGSNTVGVTGIGNTSVSLGVDTSFFYWNESGANYINYAFQRAPGYFDVVCYTGTGANATVAHNLTVAPELIFIKSRNDSYDWPVYSANVGNTSYGVLNANAAWSVNNTAWNDTSPTSSVFTVGTGGLMNASGVTYVAYLFASCPGVSKVGSYTGTGATQTINCGFTGGARFVLIKSTSTTGNWLVWDTVRGMIPSNDPYITLNTSAAEVTGTDWVDTAATGFELSNAGGNLANSSGVSYIFLAIA